MELKSMTDFVLEQEKEPILGLLNYEYQKIRNYANFLKKPLTISMFIPCGDDGEVMENPRADDNDAGTEKELLQIAYNNAKNRCLFEGFEVFDYGLDITDNISKTVCLKGLLHVFWFESITKTWNPAIGVKSLEQLTHYSLTLTQSAINQITTTR